MLVNSLRPDRCRKGDGRRTKELEAVHGFVEKFTSAKAMIRIIFRIQFMAELSPILK
ncbi:MAG: hypothetical protein JRN37_00540 [Nitrososphaerota archaeon]|jgi:hypothetical protein|nr:hypothetical protein [Nitrososphaerota archaeon]MDG7036921.1 hypothetical protein [Nitrososphaerota archaeon]MDG7037639.1 hypothetical protein [Nitrososphaerota archaeon]